MPLWDTYRLWFDLKHFSIYNIVLMEGEILPCSEVIYFFGLIL